MSQYVTLAEQIAAERSSLEALTSAQIEVRYQVSIQRGFLIAAINEIAALHGFASADDAALRHLGISVSAEIQTKSVALAAWRDACLGVAELHFQRILATGVVDDFDVLLAACPAFNA